MAATTKTRPTPAKARRLADVLRRLESEYGPHEWSPRGRPLDVLVSVVLSQNTSWTNAKEGFRRLKRDLPTWEKVLAAPVAEVQRPIGVCGLGRMRAFRLQAMLRRIKAERGRLSLAFVGRMPVGEAAAYLSGFHGVGPKTVACTLLFAFGMPVFPVDNGILRVVRRLGVVRAKIKDAEAAAIVERATTPAMRYPLHVLTYRLAKDACRPKNPKCEDVRAARRLPDRPSGAAKHATAAGAGVRATRPRRISRFISAGLLRDGDASTRRGRCGRDDGMSEPAVKRCDAGRLPRPARKYVGDGPNTNSKSTSCTMARVIALERRERPNTASLART